VDELPVRYVLTSVAPLPATAACAVVLLPCSTQDAFNNGAREKLIYAPCIVADHSRPDYLATVDVDPGSATYSQVRQQEQQHRPRQRQQTQSCLMSHMAFKWDRYCASTAVVAHTVHCQLTSVVPLCCAAAGDPPPAHAARGGRAAPLRLECLQQLLQRPQQEAPVPHPAGEPAAARPH
jgi:hypothetical protein